MADTVKKTSDLIPVRKSHIEFYNNFPLYYISKDGDSVLFKKKEDKTGVVSLDKDMPSEFFVQKKDETSVVKTLLSVLNIKLAKTIYSKGIEAIKSS